MRNLHKEITDKILAQLKTGVAPWRKPWSEHKARFGSVTPRNAVTERAYSGVNVLLLWTAAQANGWAPRWLTYKQARAAGGQVRGGEKGETVIFVKRLIVKDKDAKPGEDKRKAIGFLRAYTVFNVAQCDGLSDKVMGLVPIDVKPINQDGRDSDIEAFVDATGIKVIEVPGGKAAYAPSLDVINMPLFEDFKGAHPFYSTLFHEMGHATGHKERLDRNLTSKFGDRSYAAEELIAELTAAFTCAEWGIDMGEAQASYIDHWVGLLTERETAIVTAAAAASKAVEWMRGAASAEEADEDEEALAAA